MSKRKRWTSAAKFEIVLEVLKNTRTLNEICKHYDVAPSQVHSWKKSFLENAAQVFDNNKQAAKTKTANDTDKQALYEKIGQLTVERDFLKKVWSKYHGEIEDN